MLWSSPKALRLGWILHLFNVFLNIPFVPIHSFKFNPLLNVYYFYVLFDWQDEFALKGAEAFEVKAPFDELQVLLFPALPLLSTHSFLLTLPFFPFLLNQLSYFHNVCVMSLKQKQFLSEHIVELSKSCEGRLVFLDFLCFLCVMIRVQDSNPWST